MGEVARIAPMNSISYGSVHGAKSVIDECEKQVHWTCDHSVDTLRAMDGTPSTRLSSVKRVSELPSVVAGWPRMSARTPEYGARQQRVNHSFALRRIALALHRYVGLSITVFLVIAGVTGALLAFHHELDVAINPRLWQAPPPASDTQPMDPLALRQKLLETLPGATIDHVDLRHTPSEAVSLFVESRPVPDSQSEQDDEYFIDPYTGHVLGSRHWGDISQGFQNLMPFVYRLHVSLALDEVGEYLFGVVALLWTIDCFVGAYLTFPVSNRRTKGARASLAALPARQWAWLLRWTRSWAVRAGKGIVWVFTWHRASGLWLWGVLLIFAWSSVGLSLHEVYSPVMKALFATEDVYEELPVLEQPQVEPTIGWFEAREIGRRLIHAQAERDGLTVFEERRLGYFPKRGLYRYSVRSNLDISTKYPNTTVWFDGTTGEAIAFEAPTGTDTGTTLTTWLYHLHWGTIAAGGTWYRGFVAGMGLVVAGLSVTGVWLWWARRSKRARGGSSKRSTSPSRVASPRQLLPSSFTGIGHDSIDVDDEAKVTRRLQGGA